MNDNFFIYKKPENDFITPVFFLSRLNEMINRLR